MKRLLAVSILALAPLHALAQDDCDEEIAEIDRRIATGNYTDMNVELARQMRHSLQQMCGMLDESMRAEFMEGIEDLLPTRTEAEQRAVREEKRAAANASREARKAAKASQSIPDSGLAGIAPSGRSLASGFVDRDEDMLHFWTWDWDVYRGKARVLYMTQPARQQYGRPDWSRNIYVVEIDAAGKASQRLVTSKQARERWTVALRRGHDEVLLQRQTGGDGTPTTLERWSVSQGKQLSSVTTPTPSFPNSEKVSWHEFSTPTADGNVFFLSGFEPERGQTSAAWYEASPAGNVVGHGTLPLAGGGFTNVGATLTKDGGAAIPFMASVGFSPEIRILTISDNASASRQSAIVKGTVASYDIAPRTLPAMHSAGDEMIVLTKVIADRGLQIPVHGHWLVWARGDHIAREVYLNPMAEELGIDFKFFDVAPNGDIVLYGSSKAYRGTDYIVVLAPDGKPKSTANVRRPKNGSIKALIADDEGAWLFGHGYPTDEFSRFRFWSEQIEF
jgi:hypothetical protein